jgi:hypothetical protein
VAVQRWWRGTRRGARQGAAARSAVGILSQEQRRRCHQHPDHQPLGVVVIGGAGAREVGGPGEGRGGDGRTLPPSQPRRPRRAHVGDALICAAVPRGAAGGEAALLHPRPRAQKGAWWAGASGAEHGGWRQRRGAPRGEKGTAARRWAASGDGERGDQWVTGSAGIGRRRRGGPIGRWRASWTRRGVG